MAVNINGFIADKDTDEEVKHELLCTVLEELQVGSFNREIAIFERYKKRGQLFKWVLIPKGNEQPLSKELVPKDAGLFSR